MSNYLYPNNNDSLLQALLDEIYNCGTIMDASELLLIATDYAETYDELEEKYIIDKYALQKVADIYTNDFDCINF